MKLFAAFILSWLAAGFGALVGSILGNAAGKTGLSVGAVIGGILGVVAAVGIARRASWLPVTGFRGALGGGLIGFALAVPLTLTNMNTPMIPILSCALVGAGVLLGARVSPGRGR